MSLYVDTITSNQGLGIKNNNQNVSAPVFRGENIQTRDTVEITNKKNGLSAKAKWGIGLGTVLAFCVGLAAIAKHKKPTNIQVAPPDNLQEILARNLEITPLAEKIEFKDASTLEEAIKFTKEQLKIEDIDKDISLEALNWVNKGLVEVSNAMKGKAKMPTSIKYTELKDVEASISCSNIISNDFGTLRINKNLFNNVMALDDELKSVMFKEGKNIFQTDKCYMYQLLKVVPKNDFKQLVDKYYAGKLNTIEKRTLRSYIVMLQDKSKHILKFNPLETFKFLAEKRPDLKINTEEISKKTKEEQITELTKILTKIRDEGKPLKLEICGSISPQRLIHHESGHLQDFTQNPMCDYRMQKSVLDKLIKDGKLPDYPKEFKDFYKPEMQEIAGEVSTYAQVGISDFNAEVFAEKISGHKLSERVNSKYDAYNAPKITCQTKSLSELVSLV